MGLKEILAAKKAAADAEAKGATPLQTAMIAVPAQIVHVPELEQQPTASEQNNVAAPNVSITPKPSAIVLPEPPVKPAYPTVDANGKPLSGFALIQAKKKIDAEWAITEAAYKEKLAGIPADVFSAQMLEQTANEVQSDNSGRSDGPTLHTSGTSETTTMVFTVADKTVDQVQSPTATPEAEQAYSDLKVKLDALTSLSEDNLKTAMQELKKALMANPNAVSLMLPSDIGQMVIALRKMTGVELAVANAKTTAGKASKKKEPILSAEDMEKAWQEL